MADTPIVVAPSPGPQGTGPELWEAIKKKAVEHIATAIVAGVALAATAGAAATWAALKSIAPGLPSGAVVASTEPCDAKLGWTEYAPASGRFLVAAGKSEDRNGFERVFQLGTGANDGEYRHTLSVPEMPPHNHGVYPHAGFLDPSGKDAGAGYADTRLNTTVRSSVTTTVGDGKAFPVVPPFIALYFCRKG